MMKVCVATLRPEKIDDYEALHRDLDAGRHSDIARAGYRLLDIYRHGRTLVMLIDHDPAAATPGHVLDPAIEARWHAATGACFAQAWEDARPVFSLGAAGPAATC